MTTYTRRDLEASIRASASSIDGRTVVFQRSAHGVDVEVGGYVTIGSDTLGQVHELAHAWVEGAELAAALPDGAESPSDSRVAVVRGNGVVLDSDARPFHDVPFARAASTVVDEHLASGRASRAALDVGTMVLEPEIRFTLDSGGFDRHTFFCGQSGSGKTYALGTVLERLILETTIRIVVLDPNSDFVELRHVREGVESGLAERYRTAAADCEVRRGGLSGRDRLHVRFTDCDAEEQAAVLRLDPITDRDEYGALVDLLDAGVERQQGTVGDIAAALIASPSPHVHALGARTRNLGLHRWPIWSVGDEGSVQDLVQPGGPRVVVVDLGSLETPGEKAVAAESVLAALWRRRGSREPTLIVIDEAHNVCPREPDDPVTALATEYAARIAAEGRKFGLYMLVSTQRPQRVNELVVSQCDNLVLMRMISAGDLAYVGQLLSVAPAPLIERASSFRMGESLVAGKIASHPAFIRFGPRIAEEGGADVPAAWAETSGTTA